MNRETLLRRFNYYGQEWFYDYLINFEDEKSQDTIFKNITSDLYAEVIQDEVYIYTPTLLSRFDIGKYLYSLFNELVISDLDTDINLWSWLAAYYFDIVCKKDRNGKRTIGELSRYILIPGNFRRYYRHMLLGPYLIYKSHISKPNITKPILCSKPHILSEMFEQVVSNQWIIQSQNLLELIYFLYFNEATGKNKSGSSTKSDGSIRRLVKVLNQFARTWDLLGSPVEELLTLLPSEFDKYK